MSDERHMRRALELAARAEGRVSPRPPVGAVLVKGDRIVGEGCTAPIPGPHAEMEALRRAGSEARGAVCYVTLEPCSHTGHTPPCADALVDAGVSSVVVGTLDPNPAVDGDGIRRLTEAGIDVRTGVCSTDAARLVEPFGTWVREGRPLVTLKLATTLDGKVAAADGSSRWITGPEARSEVHELRSRVDAVLVGSGTVRSDDPALTCRLPGYQGPQPRRLVVDTSGRTPAGAKVLDGTAPATVLTTASCPPGARRIWEEAGAAVQQVEASDEGVDIRAALGAVGTSGVCHVLCEGGPALAASLVARGLVDRLVLYLAPKLIGGDAPPALAWGGKTIADAWELDIEDVRAVGRDLRIDARLRGPEEEA